MTESERRLWFALRARRFEGLNFRRQVPISRYIVDFACHELRLVIELDGDQHGWTENAERELVRTAAIAAEGYRVIRFWNFELRENFETVLDRIRAEVKALEE